MYRALWSSHRDCLEKQCTEYVAALSSIPEQAYTCTSQLQIVRQRPSLIGKLPVAFTNMIMANSDLVHLHGLFRLLRPNEFSPAVTRGFNLGVGSCNTHCKVSLRKVADSVLLTSSLLISLSSGNKKGKTHIH